MDGEKSMREVVERLRAEGSEAVLELQEFDHALEALLQNIEGVVPNFGALKLAASQISDSSSEDNRTRSTIKEQADRLSTWINQFVAGFRESQRAVQAWNISDPRSRSSVPTSVKRLLPKE